MCVFSLHRPFWNSTFCTQPQQSTLRQCILRAFCLDPVCQLLRSTSSLDALRRLHPKHSVVTSSDYRLNLLNFPGAYKIPMESTPMVSELVFIPLAKNMSPIPGIIAEQVEFGVFRLAWEVSRVYFTLHNNQTSLCMCRNMTLYCT